MAPKMTLEVGTTVIYQERQTVIVNRWAQGKFHRYILADGRQFYADPEDLIQQGKLQVLEKSEEIEPDPEYGVFDNEIEYED